MKVDFSKLRAVLKSPTRKTKKANDSSDCLSEFQASLTNYIEANHGLLEEESAMLTMSIENWIKRRKKTHFTGSGTVDVGDIFYTDLGMNYNPELAYAHPVVILEIVGSLALVVPVTTSSDSVKDAYHPTENPSGNKFLRRVHTSDGFSKTGAVILSNMRTISKGRLLDKKGALIDISKPDSLFVEIKTKCFEISFPKQHINQLKLNTQVEELTGDKAHLEKQVVELTGDKERLEKQIEELTGDKERLEKQVDVLQRMLTELN